MVDTMNVYFPIFVAVAMTLFALVLVGVSIDDALHRRRTSEGARASADARGTVELAPSDD
jgi:hypothetical protein